MNAPAGRNDPCPCGSGKKYKKCCALKKGMQKYQTTDLTGKKMDNSFFNRFANISSDLGPARSLKEKVGGTQITTGSPKPDPSSDPNPTPAPEPPPEPTPASASERAEPRPGHSEEPPVEGSESIEKSDDEKK